MARHFFALWPPEESAARLETLGRQLALDFGGRPAPRRKIHLTLAFLGAVGPEEVSRARAAANTIELAAFDVSLDRVGGFRGPRVAWAGCSQVPAGLARLAQELAGALGEAGIALDARPFVPHATLARRVTQVVQASDIPAIGWRAASFALVKSDSGAYETQERWALRG